jgi:hypothetical protein
MTLTPHAHFVDAIRSLAAVRSSFSLLAKEKLILGNDNHIGDIGEYWARRYYEELGLFSSFGSGKNAACDIKLTNQTTVSVKTLTAWSKTGYGTQIKPLDGVNWQVLAAVYLSEDLFPSRIAIVPLAELIVRPVFVKNAKKRAHPTKATKSYPHFEWWDWLIHYEVSFEIKDDNLVVSRPNKSLERTRER